MATSALSAATKSGNANGCPPGSSHSPQWNPLSHRNSSWAAGSGRAAARDGWRSVALIRCARSSQATMDGHSSARIRSSPYAR